MNAPLHAGWTDTDLSRVEQLLDAVPAPLQSLDLSMLDGYLCGVLLQPRRIAEADWFRHVLDVDGRAAPASFDTTQLRTLVRRRHAELDAAIEQRQWFDPWVFELDEAAMPLETVWPWVAGFAIAQDHFPALLDGAGEDALEALGVLYAAFDPDDLEDADDLLAVIEMLEPPADLDEAVEGLVSSTLLLADETRPRRAGARPTQRRPGPPRAGKPRR